MRWQIGIHFVLRMTNVHCVYWQWFEEFSVSLPNKEFPIQFKVWVSLTTVRLIEIVFLIVIFVCIIIIIVLTLTIARTFRIIAHWHRINCWVDLNSTSDHLHRIKCTTCGFRSLWVFIFTHQYSTAHYSQLLTLVTTTEISTSSCDVSVQWISAAFRAQTTHQFEAAWLATRLGPHDCLSWRGTWHMKVITIKGNILTRDLDGDRRCHIQCGQSIECQRHHFEVPRHRTHALETRVAVQSQRTRPQRPQNDWWAHDPQNWTRGTFQRGSGLVCATTGGMCLLYDTRTQANYISDRFRLVLLALLVRHAVELASFDGTSIRCSDLHVQCTRQQTTHGTQQARQQRD